MKGADGISGTADDVSWWKAIRLRPIDLTHAVRTGHQFLIDIAHNAVPVFDAAGQPRARRRQRSPAMPQPAMLPETISPTTTSCSTRTTSPAMAA